MICPKCGSSSTINFEKRIHIVEPNGEMKSCIIYGCEDCFLIFTMPKEKEVKTQTKQNTDKIQSIFGSISKGCNKILTNIK